MRSASKLKDMLFNTPSKDRWERIGTRRRAGILVPLFSVYSKNSVGIGDFDDLKLLIDWCARIGYSIIQLLPMNEVGALLCPYDATSSFALEPMYISLTAIESAGNKILNAGIEEAKRNFPVGRPHVDYRIKQEKECLLREIYLEEGSSDSKGFKRFIEGNAYWMNDFALFKVLKGQHSGKAWYDWEDRYRYRARSALESFWKEHEKEIAFEMWMQWIAFEQFRKAKLYAGSKKVLIKGDLPILISRDSADVWAHPEFFKLDYAAGAPPDMYCAKGQRWGMPTYNWDEIENDGYRYIKEKLKHAENFYDILRIDHVVGLFRIWSIPYNEPLENEGLNGAFDPKDEKVWEEHGRSLLSIILSSTKMLLCAEDLGIIPKACPKILKRLGIPGNDVERWTKDWKMKHDFLSPEEYRTLSVALLSTHDTTNWAAWWENEAGTVDEALFKRKAIERGLRFEHLKDRLFDSGMSKHGRLRWLDSITSSGVLVDILGRREEELSDFIDMYKDTYREKEKLWQKLNLKGPMREEASGDIIREALKITLGSKAIFCIELIVDWLIKARVFKGDPYQYRINAPGTISEKNWSLVMPISLEDLSKHKISREIKSMIASSGRA